jgi:pimeloyl-ACP methyl ester carboxylesterase
MGTRRQRRGGGTRKKKFARNFGIPYYTNLLKFADVVEPRVRGTHNGSFSIVCLPGSSVQSHEWNEWSPSNNFLAEYAPEHAFPDIRFQTLLAQITKTIVIPRATDFLNNNLFAGTRNPFYVASKKDMTVEHYAKYMKRVLDKHGVPPPYVLIGGSEGGWDAVLFASVFPTLVQRIVFIDSGIFGPLWREYEAFRGGEDSPMYGLGLIRLLEKGEYPISEPRGALDYHNREQMEQVDLFNFMSKYKLALSLTPNTLPRIPMDFYFAEHYEGRESLDWWNRKRRAYVEDLAARGYDVEQVWLPGPHQLERVFPRTLFEAIRDTLD